MQDQQEIVYDRITAQAKAHEDQLEQYRVKYDALLEAFNNSEKHITLERANLITAKDSNEKLNDIYKKSNEVLEVKAN